MNLRHASTVTYFAAALSIPACFLAPGRADHNVRIQEEVWALPLPLPMFAYVVRPVSEGHFLIGSPDTIPMWAPLVERFLDAQK
ncbi:hypothetical protein [Bradyrhizobium lupini]